jgi:serine-type D-Ala-D-Ala carboxypeptidase
MENALLKSSLQASSEGASSKAVAQAFSEVSALMLKAVEDAVFPGAVLLVGRDGQILFHKSVGYKSVKISKDDEPRPMTSDTVFDIANLTTVVATTTLLMKLVEMGKVKLEDRVSIYLQGFGVHNKSPITVGQLLAHTSGLTAWHPYYEELLKANTGARLGILTSKGARDYVINSINRSTLKYTPGTRQVASDLGFIILGHLIELLTGLGLDKALYKYVIQPLGLKSTSYVDLSMVKRRGIHPVTDVIAPTEQCPWRQRLLCGEVLDDNAWAMGGVAGHSGLFSNAFDLHIFAREVLFAQRGGSVLLKRESVAQFFKLPVGIDAPAYRFGWECPSKENGLIESRLSGKAVGCNGFSGCSMWLELEKGVDIILMSNRVHPSRSNKKINAFRPEIHSAVVDALAKC